VTVYFAAAIPPGPAPIIAMRRTFDIVVAAMSIRTQILRRFIIIIIYFSFFTRNATM